MGYQALLFCPDERLARVVTQVFSELDFTVEPVNEPFAAVKKLMAQRYDAVVVDCENEPNATLLFKSARNSSQNQSSLALALVEGQAGVAKAYRIGANLVLTKPINVEQAKGTLRVARGLLRKNSDAAAPGANAASSAAPKIAPAPPSTPFKPVPTAAEPPAATRSVYEPPEFESALPAMAASAEVEKAPIPAPPSETQTRNIASGDGPGKVQHQAPASEPVRPAPPVQSTVLKSPVASHASISGSAAAPAPAKEAHDHAEKPAASLPVAHAEASVPAFSTAGPGSSPSFAALENEDSDGSGGNKKILLVAAAVLVGVALAYFGWTKMGKPNSGSHPANAPLTQVPIPSTQTAASPGSPSLSTSEPASTGQTIVLQSTKPSASIANSGASRIGGESEPAEKKPATPIVVKSYTPGKRSQAQGEESAPQVPNPLALATTSDKGLSGLVSSGTAPLPKAPTSMLRISQGVSQGLLIKRVQPRYPQNALSMRIQGAVQMEATIDKEGNISNLKTLSGDPVLARAATDAVRQWRYKPYYLDGDPVEIQTQITVNFKLPN